MLAALLTAIQTLTRIPVPSPAPAPDARIRVWSAVFYPAVGALLGGFGVSVLELLGERLAPGLLALLILALWAFLTGALHEDGLADTFDAFGSQASREDTLRILKDSRIGSYGALALVLATLLRWQGLSSLPLEDVIFGLMASQVLPRAGVVLLAYWAGPATDGSGGGMAAALTAAPVVVTLGVSAAILLPIAGPRLLAPAAACLLLIGLLAIYFRRRLGGVTGDCLGAAEQLQEIAVLVAVLASRPGVADAFLRAVSPFLAT